MAQTTWSEYGWATNGGYDHSKYKVSVYEGLPSFSNYYADLKSILGINGYRILLIKGAPLKPFLR